MKRTVEEYMDLPYTVELIPDDGSCLAKIKELEGCMTVGDNPADALEMLEDAKREWLTVAFEDGFEIPLPESMREVKQSGKFALRMPKSLHQKLAEEAEADGVSLNQYIVALLAEKNTLASLKHLVIVQGTQIVQDRPIVEIPSWGVSGKEKSCKVLPFERRRALVVGD